MCMHDSTSAGGTADGGFGDPLDGDEPGSVTGSWDALDSTAGGTADSGIGDSLSGAEVFWMGVAGMSSWVTEQLPEAKWSIILVVGSGSKVFSIPFLVQNSACVVWKVLRQ